jgi:hypothetical protein
MLGRAQLLTCALAVLAAAGGLPAALAARQRPDTRSNRTERIHQQEGEAIVALADAASAGRRTPSDLTIDWRNDFLKAQQGTFVPFVVTIDAPELAGRGVLIYVRLAARTALSEPNRTRRPGRPLPPSRSVPPAFAFEDVYPIDVRTPPGQPVRVIRGFSAQPGDYDLVVVVRERVDPSQPDAPRRTGVLTRRLTLPEFRASVLTTSSVILAERLTVLEAAPTEEQPEERPYLIGLSDIQPAADNVFRRDEELIVVFLVYNPFVTPERKFDIEVEYHFFTRNGGRRDGPPSVGVIRPPARDGERYFNHTKPQRFTPAIMGPLFDPGAGQPLMAGQGVPLASFPEGEYRLAIKVTDIVGGKSILRDVAFTIVS